MFALMGGGEPAGDLVDHFGRSPNPNFLVKSPKMIAQLAQIDRSNRPNTVIPRFIGPRYTVSPIYGASFLSPEFLS